MPDISPEPPVTFTNAYRGAASGARYEQWREEICRGVCNMDIDPGDGELLDMRVRIANLAPALIATAAGSPAKIGRSPQDLGDGEDAFTFVCHARRPMPFLHGDRVLEIDRSSFMLGELAQSSKGVLREEFTAIVIDRKTLLGVSPRAENLLYRPQHINQELSDTIGRYAAMASETAPHIDAHGRVLMGQHLVDLVSLALGMRPDDAELARHRGQSQARLALMKADILASLDRPDLSIEMIAYRYGLGARQAQRLFEEDGTTFTAFLLERRLLLARKLLMDPKNRLRKVIDIAHSAGFSDLSYFNRAFRRRFGMTPSEARQGES